MTVSKQLRDAIESQDVTLYRISRDAEVDWGTLQRFIDGRRPDIRMSTVDKLCEYLGLELQTKKKKEKKSK
jgi:DNA-binding Xre family transcriptional regulator